MTSGVLGSARASRACLGAPAATLWTGGARWDQYILKVRDGEGAIASTRGRVRSPGSFQLELAAIKRHHLIDIRNVKKHD